ncbi:MAG: TRAP transporter small permease subunit [Xanthobacteraceae bacterium]|nr:TRAP transporter small permease subunit [Xanthobacteraceae bacterium]
MRFFERAGRAFDRLLDVCAWIGCGMLAFQVVSVSVEIICRTFFNISFSVITPLNEWSLVYLTFLGAAWLQREGGHTSDDSVVALLPPWVDWLAKRLGWVLALVTCGLLVWFGTLVTWDNYVKNTYDFFKLSGFPIFLIYLIIPIGSLLWLIQLLRKQSRPGATKTTDEGGGTI